MATELLLTEDTTLGDALARVLEQAGIDTVFGLPGGDTMRIFDALYDHQDTIRTITVREESLAGMMAEIYGRLTGRPGVVIAQNAWVIANALHGTIEAHLSSSPMILLTDLTDAAPFAHHVPLANGLGVYGGFDAKQALAAVTKETIVALDAAEAVQALQMGIRQSLSGDRGPVAVLIHSKAFNKGRPAVGPASRPRLYATERYLPLPPALPDQARIDAVAELLVSARCPVIIAGNGVRISQAYDELDELAHTLAMPVMMTQGGKGVFAEVDELGLGLTGTFGTAVANTMLGAADVVVVVGSRLGAPDTGNEDPRLIDPARQTIVQLDVEQRNAGMTFPADHILLGDAGATMRAILDTSIVKSGLTDHVVEERRRVLANCYEQTAALNYVVPPLDGGPLLSSQIVDILSDALPGEAIVTCDAGENRLFMMHLFEPKEAGAYLQSSGAAAMGYAIPAALGAKLVHPDRPVVAVCGDGGFAMTMNGLLTALEEKLPIVVVLFNNGLLGWSHSLQHDRPLATVLSDVDYAAVARGMGCDAHRVDNAEDLREALASALGADTPTVIDVLTGDDRDHTYKAVVSQLVGSRRASTTLAASTEGMSLQSDLRLVKFS